VIWLMNELRDRGEQGTRVSAARATAPREGTDTFRDRRARSALSYMARRSGCDWRMSQLRTEFGRLLRAWPLFLRAFCEPSLCPRGCGGRIPRLLSPPLNMPEVSRGTGHGVAFDKDETKDRPRR